MEHAVESVIPLIPLNCVTTKQFAVSIYWHVPMKHKVDTVSFGTVQHCKHDINKPQLEVFDSPTLTFSLIPLVASMAKIFWTSVAMATSGSLTLPLGPSWICWSLSSIKALMSMTCKQKETVTLVLESLRQHYKSTYPDILIVQRTLSGISSWHNHNEVWKDIILQWNKCIIHWIVTGIQCFFNLWHSPQVLNVIWAKFRQLCQNSSWVQPLYHCKMVQNQWFRFCVASIEIVDFCTIKMFDGLHTLEVRSFYLYFQWGRWLQVLQDKASIAGWINGLHPDFSEAVHQYRCHPWRPQLWQCWCLPCWGTGWWRCCGFIATIPNHLLVDAY